MIRLVNWWLGLFMFHGSGGGGGGSNTTTNVLYSPEEARRRSQVMDTAATLFGSQPTNAPPYPGAAPVPFSPETVAGQNLATNIAGQQQQAGTLQSGALQYGLHDIINGKDPTLDNAINAAVRPIHEAYTGTGGYFAQNRADMVGSNMLGSTRDALTNAVIGENYTRGLGDTAAKLAAASRADTLGTFNKTLGAAPMVTSSLTQPAETLAAVGGQKEGMAAAQEDYAAQQRQWQLNYPWLNLQNYANIVYGGQSPSSQAQTQMDAARNNPTMGTVGGAGVGYMVGSSAAMTTEFGSMAGPYGAAIGALVGYMMSR